MGLVKTRDNVLSPRPLGSVKNKILGRVPVQLKISIQTYYVIIDSYFLLIRLLRSVFQFQHSYNSPPQVIYLCQKYLSQTADE